MSNMLFDHYPADIEPWPEGVPRQRVRAIGFPTGLVILWDPGGEAVQRMDIPPKEGVPATARQASGYAVQRGAGCACGSRRLRSMKVTAPVMTEPQSPEETEAPVESPV